MTFTCPVVRQEDQVPVHIRPLGDALGAEVCGLDFSLDLPTEDAKHFVQRF